MVKILIPILLFCLLYNPVFALNTKSSEWTVDAGQSLWIADGDISGGLKFTGAFTAEFWIKKTTDTNNTFIESYAGAGDNRDFELDFSATANTIIFYTSTSGTAGTLDTHTISYDLATHLNEWILFSFTFSGVGATTELFINGSSVGTDTQTNTEIHKGTLPFTIGATNQEAATNYNGLMDQVVFWSDVRSDAEILAGYNGGDGICYVGNEAGMITYLQMEGNTLDTNANGNDFTNDNAVNVNNVDVPFTCDTPAPAGGDDTQIFNL